VISSNTCLVEQCHDGPSIPTSIAVLSDVINVTLSDHAGPPQTDLSVDATGTKVEVSWKSNSDTGGTPVTAWIIERDNGTASLSNHSNTEFSQIARLEVAESRMFFVDSPPLNVSVMLGWCSSCPVRYRYRVRPVNAAGESRWSSIAQDAWMVPTPGLPTASLLNDVDGGPCLVVAWDNVSYAAFYQVRGELSDPEDTADSSGSFFVNGITDLQSTFCPDDRALGKRYAFSVRGVNLAGNEGPWSSYVSGFMARAPYPPSQVRLVDADCYRGPNITFRCNTLDFGIIPNTTAPNTTACNKLSWRYSEDDGGCRLVEYQLFRDGTPIAMVPASNTFFADFNASLVCGEQYRYAIRAINYFVETATGWECNGNGLTAKPYSSTSLYYSWPRLGAASSLRVDWQSGFVGNSSILGYILFHDDGRMGDMQVVYNGVGQPSQNFYVQRNLTPGLTYRAIVKAVTTVGEGEPSPTLYTVMAEPPDPPTNLRIEWATPTGGVDIYWTPPVYTGHSPITHYVVQHRVVGESSDFFTVPRTPSGVEQGPYRLDENDDLAGDREFEFRMASVNVAGRSRWSSTVSRWLGERPLALPERLGPWISRINMTHLGISWPELDDESLLRMANIFIPRKDVWGYILDLYSFTGNFTPTEVLRVTAESAMRTAVVAVPQEATCGGLFCVMLRLWTLVGDGPTYPERRVCTETSDLPGMPVELLGVPSPSNMSNVWLTWQEPAYSGCHIVVQYLVEVYDTVMSDSEVLWSPAK
ncbi:hypothetical protein FOZ62_027739, partial [Perkinsus olseni]